MEMISIFAQYKGLSKSAYVIFFARIITNMGAFIWPLMTFILVNKMGYTESQTALVAIVIGVIYLPATILGGRLADRFNRKYLIVFLDTLSVIFFISCAFVEPGFDMLIRFSLAGLFANMEGPAFEALISDVTKPAEREKVFSLSYLGHNLGFVFGAAIGGMLFENHLSLAFIIDGLTTFLSTILIVIFVVVIKQDALSKEEINEYENHELDNKRTFLILKERKSIWIQIITFFLIAFIYDQWTFTLPIYLNRLYLSDGARYFGYLASFNGGLVIIFTPIITKLLGKSHEMPKMMLGVAFYALSFLVIMNEPKYFVFFIMMFMFTIGEIVNMLGSSPFISRRVPASHRGRVNSLVHVGFFLGSVVGKGVMGLIIQYASFNIAFITIALTGFATVGLIFTNYKIDKKLFPNLYKSKLTDIRV